MADRREVGAVYGAGLVQGIALVTFPAASSILTSPSYYDLTSSAYGSLFLPQAIAAIASALAGARLTVRLGLKRTTLLSKMQKLGIARNTNYSPLTQEEASKDLPQPVKR